MIDDMEEEEEEEEEAEQEEEEERGESHFVPAEFHDEA
jgi:hypothetical protein